MSISWEASYVGQLRQKVGHDPLIIPSIRAILQNDKQEILFIERRGSSSWGMPAGSIEIGESIEECLKREVWEETGLTVEEAALYSGPHYTQTNGFGDTYQMFEFVFLVKRWSGELVQETDESTNAAFFPEEQLPNIGSPYWLQHTRDVLADVKQFQGTLLLR